MGFILLITPALIYYLVLVPIIKIGTINKLNSARRSRMLWLGVVLVLPFSDHLLGYTLYKTLCFTKGGTHIYKTVTDEQEQRDYWFKTYNQYRPASVSGERYGIEGRNYLTKDLKHHKTVYINNCSSQRWESYDCEKAEKYIQDSGLKIYTFSNDTLSLPRDVNDTSLIENSPVEATRLINEKTFTLEVAYLNHCNPLYNTLPTDDPNYRYSCKNAEEVIEKYALENVVKVPRSPYESYSKNDGAYAGRLGKKLIPFLELYQGYGYMKNMQTGELMYESYSYHFRGGWYVNTFNPYYPYSTSCERKIRLPEHQSEYDKSANSVSEIIIPNPYKTLNTKGN